MKSTVRQLPAQAADRAADLDTLCVAFLRLNTVEECRLFLSDLCTPAEILALTERWRIARLLAEGHLSYREIHDRTGGSLATITRVARFLKQEPYQGYRLVLERVNTEKGKKAKPKS